MFLRKNGAKAQGTIEYMIVIVIALAVALLAVTWGTGLLFENAGQVSAMQNTQYWAQQSIGLADALIDGNGDAVFVLKNNTEYPLTLIAYSLGDDLRPLSQGILFKPGETKSIFFAQIGECANTGSNTCSYDNLVFRYSTGEGNAYSSGGAALVTGKSPDVSSLDLTSPDDWICVQEGGIVSCESAAGGE